MEENEFWFKSWASNARFLHYWVNDSKNKHLFKSSDKGGGQGEQMCDRGPNNIVWACGMFLPFSLLYLCFQDLNYLPPPSPADDIHHCKPLLAGC
jgi:hypothetical protein